MTDHDELRGRHVAFLSWRDTHNPEGGGAERYLEKMAQGLVERGVRVTIFCAAHAAAPPDEVVDGVRFIRRGSKLTVYSEGFRALARGRLGHVDVVVDVQNGLPFFTRAATRAPVVVLVHHVHREQWPVVYPGSSAGSAGPSSTVSRRVSTDRASTSRCRGRRATSWSRSAWTVGASPSCTTARIRSCPRGSGSRLTPRSQWSDGWSPTSRSSTPSTRPSPCVTTIRDLRLHVVGSGWWEAELHRYAADRGAGDTVVFEGHVDENRKHEVYEQAWALALPSLKEGWGLVVGEAGMHRTPTVAYRSAGGTRESIAHDVSGLLVDEPRDFVDALRDLLTDAELRARLGEGSLEVSHRFTWEHAQESFAHVVAAVLRGERVDAQDPDAE